MGSGCSMAQVREYALEPIIEAISCCAHNEIAVVTSEVTSEVTSATRRNMKLRCRDTPSYAADNTRHVGWSVNASTRPSLDRHRAKMNY